MKEVPISSKKDVPKKDKGILRLQIRPIRVRKKLL